MTDFRVSTNEQGRRRWWVQRETIPPTDHSIRPATAPEAGLMRRILAHDAAGRMPPVSLGQKLGALFAATP